MHAFCLLSVQGCKAQKAEKLIWLSTYFKRKEISLKAVSLKDLEPVPSRVEQINQWTYTHK